MPSNWTQTMRTPTRTVRQITWAVTTNRNRILMRTPQTVAADSAQGLLPIGLLPIALIDRFHLRSLTASESLH